MDSRNMKSSLSKQIRETVHLAGFYYKKKIGKQQSQTEKLSDGTKCTCKSLGANHYTKTMTISGRRRGPHNLWKTVTIQHQSKVYIFKNTAAVNCDTHGCTTELAGWWLLTDMSLICAPVSQSFKQVTEPLTVLVRFQTCAMGRRGRQNQCACMANGVQVLSSSVTLWAFQLPHITVCNWLPTITMSVHHLVRSTTHSHYTNYNASKQNIVQDLYSIAKNHLFAPTALCRACKLTAQWAAYNMNW
jgi:hypothetical protein